MSLTWKTSFSENDFRIFRGKLVVGILKLNFWKNAGYGELNGYLLRFQTRGLFQKNTILLDIEGKKELGQISFNYWKSSATITYEGLEYAFSYQSWTRRSWSVTSADGTATFEYKGLMQKEGAIDEDYLSPAVLLSALYTNACFGRMMAAVS